MACVLDNPEQPRESLMKIFSLAKEEKKPIYALAPMVRYSKLSFRQLVRSYGVTVAYTPMILADVFRNSSEGRDNEFRTSLGNFFFFFFFFLYGYNYYLNFKFYNIQFIYIYKMIIGIFKLYD